jgi:hypothetical protein
MSPDRMMRTAERLAWIVVPAISLLLVLNGKGRAPWYHLDEWALIDQTRGSLSIGGALEGFRGHIVAVNYLLYALQQRVFGLEDVWLVYGAYALSLVGIQISIALLLARLDVPTALALAAGTMAAFSGMTDDGFQFQVGQNVALIAGLLAVRAVVGRELRPRGMAIAGALLVVAVLADNALGLLATGWTLIIVAACWPRRALLLGVPALTVGALWQLLGVHNDVTSATLSLRQSASYASHLVLTSAGSLRS